MTHLALLLLVVADGSVLGRGESEWLKDLDGGVAERRAAVFALGKLGIEAGHRVVPALTKALTDPDDAVRAGAARGLADLFTADRTLAGGCWDRTGPALSRAADDREGRVRRAVMVAIGSAGPAGEPALTTLRKGLTDADPEVKRNAAWAVGAVGAIDAETLDELCERLHDADALVRRDALAAIADLHKVAANRPKMKTAGAALVRMLREEITPEGTARDPVVLKLALGKLLGFGPVAIDNLGGTLKPLLDGGDEELSRLAAMTLASAGGKDGPLGIDVLVRTLRKGDATAREMAAASLAQLGPLAEPAVDALAEAIRPNQPVKVRQNAAVALAQMKRKARPAINALMETIREPAKSDDERLLRRFAVEALAQMGFPSNTEALPLMAEVAGSETDPHVRLRAVWCFLNCDKLTPESEQALTKLLDLPRESDRTGARVEAARILARVLKGNAPLKAVEILDVALTNSKTEIFGGTGTRVNTGGEQTAGSTATQTQSDPDARFLYAEALGYIGAAVKKSPIADEVRKHLEDAKVEKNRPKLNENAKKALEAIGF